MKTSKYKIALVICWYGPFPWYWKFFVHSMRYNPSIDCIIISDEQQEELLPSNIKIVKKTLAEVKTLAEEKLGFEISLDYAYKLCDLKPAYGLIFEDLLSGYDFWGHGDIDVIFGNIRNFITDSVLEENDLISVRRDFLTGYFMLFRNTIYMNRLFTKSKDYKMVYENARSWCFDECNHMHQEIQFNRKNILEVESAIDSMEHVIQREIKAGDIKALFDFMVVEGNPGNIRWKNGHLHYKDKYEILLYHFIAFKSLKNRHIPKWNSMPSEIFIGDCFITSPSEKNLRKLNLKLNLLIGKLVSSVKFFIRIDLVGKFISSTTIKKKKFELIDFVGNYRMKHLSISYNLFMRDNQLFMQENKYRSFPLYHLWTNTFITPDFKTILRGQKKGENTLFKIDNIGSNNDYLIKQ